MLIHMQNQSINPSIIQWPTVIALESPGRRWSIAGCDGDRGDVECLSVRQDLVFTYNLARTQRNLSICRVHPELFVRGAVEDTRRVDGFHNRVGGWALVKISALIFISPNHEFECICIDIAWLCGEKNVSQATGLHFQAEPRSLRGQNNSVECVCVIGVD